MEKLLDLTKLGSRLAAVDTMLMQLVLRRMELAEQVGRYKRQNGGVIFRAQTEDGRIEAARKWALAHGLNVHFAESIMYSLINESCKLQMIQLQEKVSDTNEPKTDDQWYGKLKRNLLVLTERWCSAYDAEYENSYFATKAYLQYEHEVLTREIQQLPDTELMIDLGCATGRMSFKLHDTFSRVVGYDISQHMQARANQLADSRNLHSKLSFECVDLEDGIPMPDACASFIVMNLGTASDIRDIGKVIEETLRVLKPGGRFFFSFYNRDALVYRWEFLPWQAGLAASVNIHRDSLDVHFKTDESKEEIIPVYARAYTKDEVTALFADRGMEVSMVTYPTVSAILPRELFASQLGVQESVIAIDSGLTDSSLGAYIIATGQKL
jgi:SAM-dependent methyltransferase/chorismate mutase